MNTVPAVVHGYSSPATLPYMSFSQPQPVYQSAELGVQHPPRMFEMSASSRVMAELGSHNISEMGGSPTSNQVSVGQLGGLNKSPN